MAIIHLNESSSGATRLSGTTGDANAFFKWALVTNGGWTNPFTATNADIFVAPSGNKFPLFVNHDSAVSGAATLCLVRGCESATAAGTGTITNPFPTVAQVANASANWIISSAASTVSRAFDIFISPTGFLLFINANGGTNTWELNIFGDMAPTIAADTWCTVCSSRNSSGVTTGLNWALCSNAGSSLGSILYFVRSIDGSVNSTHAGVTSATPATLGSYTVSSAATMQNGPSGLIDRKKIILGCTGANTTSFSTAKGLWNRASIPQLWETIHSGPGTVNTRDTFTDSAYNPSAAFQVVLPTTAAGGAVVETTATWNPPAV